MPEPNSTGSTSWQRFAWCLYDFANSAYTTVIITAVYVIYFKGVVVGPEPVGRSDNLWGIANSSGAFCIFLLAPLFGAIADIGGKKRLFLMILTLLCVGTTAGLAATGPGTVAVAVILVIFSIIGFEGGCVFYNAFLPDLAPPEEIGRLSGKGWALGYVGGLGCLLLLALTPIAERKISLVPLIVAAWYLVFSLPMLIMLKDRLNSGRQKLSFSLFKSGFQRLVRTYREIRTLKSLSRFLLAFFIYNQGVTSIIIFAVAFAKDSLNFSTRESIYLITVMNVVAAPSALFFGWLADRIGARSTLVTTLIIWLGVVAGAELSVWPGVFTSPADKYFFWIVAGFASLAIGSIQATSRGFVGQLAPEGRAGEFYGFMAFAGKGSAIFGPFIFGLLSEGFASQIPAVASLGLWFFLGLLLLLRVPKQS
jgi:UMF1 family MFS transporter